MKNVTELRTELCKTFDGLRNKTVDAKVACQMNNAAGKIINTLKVQLEYAVSRKEKPSIAFMSGK